MVISPEVAQRVINALHEGTSVQHPRGIPAIIYYKKHAYFATLQHGIPQFPDVAVMKILGVGTLENTLLQTILQQQNCPQQFIADSTLNLEGTIQLLRVEHNTLQQLTSEQVEHFRTTPLIITTRANITSTPETHYYLGGKLLTKIQPDCN